MPSGCDCVQATNTVPTWNRPSHHLASRDRQSSAIVTNSVVVVIVTLARFHFVILFPPPLASPAMVHLGTCPLRLTTIYFFSVHFDLSKSDSDYMSTVASCKNPVTFACAPPGTKSWRRHCPQQTSDIYRTPSWNLQTF